ncbi:MAG TPA: hypothetical protein VEX67_00315 [Solirubrobacteraceae bacterium]|nr:hypothetical protein [Solirubrobacteraceae bacterium]
MTTTTLTLIEPPASDEAPDTHPGELSPLLGFVPVAGPPAFAVVGLGAVLLLLLVPPIALVATLIGLALVVAAALAALAGLAAAIVAAPVLLVRRLRGLRLGDFSLPVLRVRNMKVRRV